MQPLSGIRVIDFSTLLPGPMCTLMLAEAGADVIKIERPGIGDEMRHYEPKLGDEGVNFALLNRGKRSLAANLKDPVAIAHIKSLVKQADVLVEQFRPGVMQRLGLGFEDLAQINPRLIYCSITGWGQDGPLADIAAHDLNYQAQTGMLSLSSDDQSQPIVPPTLTADIAGGTYPAVINILMALRQRDADNKGCHLDVSMADNLFTFMYWGLGSGWASNTWPLPGQELVTGGSPRYRIYRTKDKKYLAVAPLEERFWETFLDIIGLPELKGADPMAPVKQEIARRIEQEPLSYWLPKLTSEDVCVNEVKTLEQATQDPHFLSRKLFKKRVTTPGGQTINALPVPIDAQFRDDDLDKPYPALNEQGVEAVQWRK